MFLENNENINYNFFKKIIFKFFFFFKKKNVKKKIKLKMILRKKKKNYSFLACFINLLKMDLVLFYRF